MHVGSLSLHDCHVVRREAWLGIQIGECQVPKCVFKNSLWKKCINWWMAKLPDRKLLLQ